VRRRPTQIGPKRFELGAQERRSFEQLGVLAAIYCREFDVDHVEQLARVL
jgi:hypothetical protein